MERGKIISPTRAAVRAHNILYIHALDHPFRRLFGRRITQIIAIGDQRLIAVAAVQVDISICVADKDLEEHMRQPLGLAPFPVAGEHAVEIFAVLEDAGHGAVFKARTVDQRNKDHVAAQYGNVKLIGQLDGRLNADIFRVVDACGDQHSRSRLLTAEQDVRDVQLGALHVDVIFYRFARRQLVPGDHFCLHGSLRFYFITVSRATPFDKPPRGIRKREKAAVNANFYPPGGLTRRRKIEYNVRNLAFLFIG